VAFYVCLEAAAERRTESEGVCSSDLTTQKLVLVGLSFLDPVNLSRGGEQGVQGAGPSRWFIRYFEKFWAGLLHPLPNNRSSQRKKWRDTGGKRA
jgi:hypothetical protein